MAGKNEPDLPLTRMGRLQRHAPKNEVELRSPDRSLAHQRNQVISDMPLAHAKCAFPTTLPP